MTILALNALDTLFFRDGKPFSIAEETWAAGIFPPSPSAVYGALRTAYLSEHIAELTHANGEHDQTLRLKLEYYAYHRSGEYYYPCPLDIVEKKERQNRKVPEYMMLKLVEKTNEQCSSSDLIDMPWMLQAQVQAEDASGLIDEISLNQYLRFNTVPTKLCGYDEYLIDEPKIGIGKNNRTGASEDGMLYRVGMKRMEKMSLAVGYSGVNLSGTLMKLGAEGKSVSVSVLEHEPIVRMPENLSTNLFKLYLATPAFFKEGWRPSLATISGAQLVAAVVGRPICIGGFDMKPKNGKAPRPKPMRRAVPAGSVYYYRGLISDVARLHGTSISDFGSEQGYGIVYIGNTNTEILV